MPSAKFALAAALAAISLAACGSSTKPQAGTLKAVATVHKGVDDPRKKHIVCLQQAHIPVVKVGSTAMQIASRPNGPTVYFEPTPGAAQELQIDGQVQGAEVIGSALLYPNQSSDQLLKTVEGCVAQGVSG
jgi:hypothetical protein